MTEYRKPLPTPDIETQGYWDGCKRHELLMQRCLDCGTYRFPPMPMCPKCNSVKQEWARVSGKGKIYSWFVVHQATHPDFVDEVPYAVVLVQLEEQADLRIPSNMVDCQIEDIHEGMPVEVIFDNVTEEISLPRFQPARR